MKKLFAVLMAMLIVFSICVPSFAVEIDNTNTSGNAIATYEANSSFKVTIPTYIAPSEKGETASANMYSVTASDVFIPDGNQLTVTVDYDGVLTDRNGVEIPYKLFSGGSEVTNGQKIIAKDAGNPDDTATVNFSATVQAEPRYAGTYIDNVTFNISVEERVYSLEEINADEHLYAIGKTKPEYVVAKFNDDYSEVTVVKNGSESDGEMKEWLYEKSESPFTENAETLKISAVKDGVTNISNRAFYNCTALTNVKIPDSVMRIGHHAFQNCSLLTNITIPNSVTSIDSNAFQGCTSLERIIIPDSVTSISTYAFQGCVSLASTTISNSVKNLEASTFEGCTSLTSITIPHSVTSIGNGVFSGCSSLTSVIIPDSVMSIGYSAFRNCASLTSVTIPKSVTSIGSYAFSECTLLTSIEIPSGVTSIEKSTFDGCSSLTSVTISDSVTNIGNMVFWGCTSLTSITIPSSVISINSAAFSRSGLKTIYGVSGSYAETFAAEKGYTFIAQS